MASRFYVFAILGASLLFSSIAVPVRATFGDDAQEKMSKFQRAVKRFHKKWNQYNRCMKRKCSKEESEEIKRELKVASKNAALYGGLTVAALYLIIGSAIGMGYSIKRVQRPFNEDKSLDVDKSLDKKQITEEKQLTDEEQKALVEGLFDKKGIVANLDTVTKNLGKLLGKDLSAIRWIQGMDSHTAYFDMIHIQSGLKDEKGRYYIALWDAKQDTSDYLERLAEKLLEVMNNSHVEIEWKYSLLKITYTGEGR